MALGLPVVVTALHPFSPGNLLTQCQVPGCWGWVDDPRHNARLPRLGLPARPAAQPRRRRRKTTDLLPNCYSPKSGRRPIGRTCPTCKARPDRRCWDMRSVLRYPDAEVNLYGQTRPTPHRARRVRQGARTEEESNA